MTPHTASSLTFTLSPSWSSYLRTPCWHPACTNLSVAAPAPLAPDGPTCLLPSWAALISLLQPECDRSG